MVPASYGAGNEVWKPRSRDAWRLLVGVRSLAPSPPSWLDKDLTNAYVYYNEKDFSVLALYLPREGHSSACVDPKLAFAGTPSIRCLRFVVISDLNVAIRWWLCIFESVHFN